MHCVCVCVCLTGRFVSVLSIVRGKYDLWSLLMRRMKHLYSSDTKRLVMCRLIPVDLSLSVDHMISIPASLATLCKQKIRT